MPRQSHILLNRLKRIWQVIITFFVAIAAWFRSRVVNPVGEWVSGTMIGMFEETTKASDNELEQLLDHFNSTHHQPYFTLQSIVREWFNSGGRYAHTFSATVISIFSRQSYSKRHRRVTSARSKAWQSWWDDVKHLGTFNALIEREGLFSTSSDSQNGHDNSDGDNNNNTSSDGNNNAAREASRRKRHQSSIASTSIKTSNTLRHRHTTTHNTNTTRSWYMPSIPSFFSKRNQHHATKTKSGAHLFAHPGQILTEQAIQRGLMEDTRLAIEVGISTVFKWLQSTLRKIFFLEKIYDNNSNSNDNSSNDDHDITNNTNTNIDNNNININTTTVNNNKPSSLFQRSKSVDSTRQNWKDLSVFTAADAILRAGYPLEEHTATTPDGYVLSMHRIPRRGGRDVVFLQHGVLDTSLGWVANGPGGSIAFSAYDAGFDVWLANTRSNPPRVNVRKDKQGSRYWKYSANDLSMGDLPTQMNYIHRVKLSELTDGGGLGGGNNSSIDDNNIHQSPSNNNNNTNNNNNEVLVDMATIDTTLPLRRTQSDSLTEVTPTLPPSLPPPLQLHHHRNNNKVVSFNTTHDDISIINNNSSNSSNSSDNNILLSQLQTPLSPTTINNNNITTTTTTDLEHHLPYRLQAVGHSLGAASLLMYAVACRMTHQPHRLSRLVLLSPAGFHIKIPWMIKPCVWIMPLAVSILQLFRPGCGIGLRLPSPILRWIAFKLVADLQRSPATLDLLKASMKIATGGDASAWDKAIALPHYSVQSMPAVSLHTANQFAQWAQRPEFRLYDYGSPAKNRMHYGSDTPPSIAQNYHLLKDIPVDVVAGTEDGLVPPDNVAAHLRWLRTAGVKGEFREYAYGHLAFTFGVRDEVVQFVLSRLRQTAALLYS